MLSFTLRKVSNEDGNIKTKVSELYVGNSLVNTSSYEMPSFHRVKGTRMKFDYGYVWGVRLLRVTRDVLLADVALNPGHVARVECSKCYKVIRKNQGMVNCIVCSQPYHLKCVDVEFELNKKCVFCNMVRRYLYRGR